MEPDQQPTFAVLITTVLLLVMFALMGVLMVVNTSRRHRHRAELAELHLRRDQELRQAEREATGHTLSEMGRELHDNVGQLLTVAKVGLLDNLDPGMQQHPRINASLEALDQGLQEVRRLGRSLNQDHWQQRELIEALELDLAAFLKAQQK